MKVMEGRRFVALLWPLIVLLGFAGCSTPPSVDANRWQAGMAEVDITPPLGYRMAGYFDQRLSDGVHDPLKAKALVLEQGQQRVALVFCDLLGVSLEVSRKAREQASAATGIPVTNIVIAATHSHTGPLFDDVRRDFLHKAEVARYGRDRMEPIDYPAFLTQRLVEVISEAAGRVRYARLTAGVATQPGLPFNRRYHMKNGTVVFNPGLLNSNIVGPAGPVDSDVGILLVKDYYTTRVWGGLTVFAMHPDTVGGTKFSADYPYYIEQSLRQAFGSNFISVFGQGTSGDLNHVDVSKKGPVTGFAVSQALGRNIAATVVADVPNLRPINHPALEVRSRTLVLPLQTVTPRQVAESEVIMDRLRDRNIDFMLKVRSAKNVDLARRGATWPLEIQVIRLDKDTAIVCLPAEIFVDLGLAIKAASPFKHTLVLSICNDRPGYVPTLKAFSEGSYEIVNSRLKPGGGETMVEAAVKMLNDLKRSL